MVLPQPSPISHSVRQQENGNLYKEACKLRPGLIFAIKEQFRLDAMVLQIGKGHGADIFCVTGCIT